MALKRADKLKSMKMPSKPMAEEDVEMDLSLEEMPEDEEMPMGEETPEEEMNELDIYSDEELIEEMKKRGLMEGEEMPEEEMPEEEMDIEEEDMEV